MSLSVGRKTIKEKNTKPRVRSVPAGSDNYQINFSPNLKRPPLTQLWPNKSNFLGDIFEKCPDRQPVSMCFATASRGLPIARVKPKFLIGQVNGRNWKNELKSNQTEIYLHYMSRRRRCLGLRAAPPSCLASLRSQTPALAARGPTSSSPSFLSFILLYTPLFTLKDFHYCPFG